MLKKSSKKLIEKNILLFIDSLGSGGAQRQIVTLANALAAEGHNVSLLTFYPQWHYRSIVDSDHVNLVYLERHGKFDILFVFKLICLLYTLKPNVILSYLFTPNVLIRLAKVFYFRRSRVVTSERNVDLPHSSIRLYVEKLMSFLSDAVVTNAYATRHMLIDNNVCAQDKIRVIRNGIDVSQYTVLSDVNRSAYRNSLGIKDDKFLILLPGRIQQQKNHISLLKALTLVPGSDKKCSVLFVGDVIDTRIKYQLDYFIDKNLSNVDILFAGQIDNMNAVYEIADLVVLPSLFEGLPNVVIEAMYKAKLIAISDVSDNASIIRHGETGFIHNVDDYNALAVIISQLIDMDKHEANRIQNAARDDFMMKFTVEVMLENYNQVLFYENEMK